MSNIKQLFLLSCSTCSEESGVSLSLAKEAGVLLIDGKTQALGRGPLTKIQSAKCSRQQVEFTPNYSERSLLVKQLGPNNSEIYTGSSSKLLHKGEHCTIPLTDQGVQKGVTVCFLPGQLKFWVLAFGESGLKEESEASESLPGSITNVPKIEDDVIKGIKRKDLEGSGDRKEANSFKHLKSTPKECPQASDAAQSQADLVGWTDVSKDLLVYTAPGANSRAKVAAFDMDGTLITPKSGAKFPKDKDDWKFLFPEVPGRLQKLYEEGFKIVILTNQKGIQTGITSERDIKHKLEAIGRKVKPPFQVFIAKGSGSPRKPNIGMWEYLVSHGNGGIPVNKSESFYVGDAAGRVANWAPKKKKDHSAADRLFAANAQLKFHTPEEFFLRMPVARFAEPEFSPCKLVRNPPKHMFVSGDTGQPLTLKEVMSSEGRKRPEVIIMVGSPGSGKSTFAKAYLVSAGYEYANRDTLGTWQKCVSVCEAALKRGDSVVVDNTNGDAATRARYTGVARKLGAPCRAFVMKVDKAVALHNEKYRQLMESKHKAVGMVIFHTFYKRFEAPDPKKEGFEAVINVNFVPEFKSEKEKEIYSRFLLA